MILICLHGTQILTAQKLSCNVHLLMNRNTPNINSIYQHYRVKEDFKKSWNKVNLDRPKLAHFHIMISREGSLEDSLVF